METVEPEDQTEPGEIRHDHQAMLAEHAAVAERVEREVEEALAAAAEKRRAFESSQFGRMRAGSGTPPSARGRFEEDASRLLLAAARAADDVRQTSRGRALDTLRRARERARRVDAEADAAKMAVAELDERLREAEEERAAIVAEGHAEAARIVAEGRLAEERASELERHAKVLYESREAEIERLAGEAAQQRRAEIDAEARDIVTAAQAQADEIAARADRVEEQSERLLMEAQSEAERIAVTAAATQERAIALAREAEESLARATAESDRLMAVTAEERLEAAEAQAKEIVDTARAEADRRLLAAAEAEDRAAKLERAATDLHERALSEVASFESGLRSQVEADAHERLASARREADEILANARAEAERMRTAAVQERDRMRELLSGALASLDNQETDTSEQAGIVDDLSPKLRSPSGETSQQ